MIHLVWLRNDLRLEDNPALYRARKQGEVICVYLVTDKQWQQHHDAAIKVSLWRERLKLFAQELDSKNIPLKILQVPDYKSVPKMLLKLSQTLGATALWFNREYPLNEVKRDQAVEALFEQHRLNIHSFHSDVIHEPGSVRTQSDKMYHVYSPFARRWRQQVSEDFLVVLPPPRKQHDIGIHSDDIDQHWPQPKQNHREDLWPCDTKALHKRLNKFVDHSLVTYGELRDIPSVNGTSILSPYMVCGALSVRQCIQACRERTTDWLNSSWVNELIWREFYRHLIATYPHISRLDNFKAIAKPIPWHNDAGCWQAWCSGATGYPIVDAAMKQLQKTGWMHNRLRMVVAAFLTKLLLIDWRWGEQFFMEHLIDGDFASNNGGWQWAASTGADAAPYFRIFNPLRQSERFDPEGKFIRKFLPQLAELDNKSIHNPSSQQRQVCRYPLPIIDYKYARERALDVYAGAMGKA